jgi:hypothetical protein
MVALITPLAEPSGPATLQLLLLVPVPALPALPLGAVGLPDPPQPAIIAETSVTIAIRRFTMGISSC